MGASGSRQDLTGAPRADAAWATLLDIAGRRGLAATATNRSGDTVATPWLTRGADGHWRLDGDAPADCRDLLSLYLPLCAEGPRARWVVGHLGQSLDGCIATADGDACFVTGRANIVHLHRMRALCDAVLVGAGTVACDDPRLTTRLVPGPNPVRVVIDPRRRLRADHRLFQDEAAPTLLCTASDQPGPAPGRAEIMRLPATAEGIRLDALVAALAVQGLKRLFVEGGGVTVSAFLHARLLSRLQLAVAPLLIGQGRPGLRLPRSQRLADALRLAPRIYRMGADLLYDVDLTATGAGEERLAVADEAPVRVL